MTEDESPSGPSGGMPASGSAVEATGSGSAVEATGSGSAVEATGSGSNDQSPTATSEDSASTSAPRPRGGRRVVAGRSELFLADELVVASEHVRLVRRVLRDLGAAPRLRDSDAALGLSLLRVDPSSAVAAMESSHSDVLAAARSQARADGIDASPLHLLTIVLRRVFADAYAGWTPTFGKNRIVDRVDGLQKFQYEGVESPQAAEGPDQKFQYESVSAPRGTVTPGQKFQYEGYDGPVVVGAGSARVLTGSAKAGRGVRVGLIDTKIAPHPYLLGRFVAAAADIRRPGIAEDASTSPHHATFVAGLILRQAPGAVVHLHRGLTDAGSQDSWSLAKSVAAMGREGLDVLNLSLGCFTDDGQPPLVLAAALAALGPDTLVVAAAGNHGTGKGGPPPPPCWPAAFESVVAVGALDGRKPAPFSPDAPWVDVLAPGAHVTSTYVDQLGVADFARWSGTSFSAAVVSGAVAAQTVPGRTDAHRAWDRLRESGGERKGRRPVIGVRTPAGWPLDGPPRIKGGGS